MSTVVHPDLPHCGNCGSTRGLWIPTDDRGDRGAQVFQCAPGHGCATYPEPVDYTKAPSDHDVSQMIMWARLRNLRPATVVDVAAENRALSAGQQWEILFALPRPGARFTGEVSVTYEDNPDYPGEPIKLEAAGEELHLSIAEVEKLVDDLVELLVHQGGRQ
ncbi:hypothetical protein ACWDNI_16105 [Nocardia niigatensis]